MEPTGEIVNGNDNVLLRDDIDDKLVKMIKEKMNTEEQHMFVQSFSMYLKHGHDEQAFVVNFDDVWQWIGFSRKDSGKRLVLKHLENGVDYIRIRKPLLHNGVEQTSGSGGHNKETLMMTVNAFKDLCLRADTERAKQVRQYYRKMESIVHKYTAERAAQDRTMLIEENKNLANNWKLERHNVLIDAHNRTKLVYLMCMKTFKDGSYILKIGRTSDIKNRLQHLSSEFGLQITVLDVFTCENNTAFEQFLLHEPKIVRYKYTDIINNDKKSHESFHVTDLQYDKIKRIIKSNIYKFYHQSIDEMKECNRRLELENDRIKLELEATFMKAFADNPTLLIQALQARAQAQQAQAQTQLSTENAVKEQDNTVATNIDNDIEDTADSVNMVFDQPIADHHLGRPCGQMVHMYDADDTTRLQQVFEGITDVTRQVQGASFSQIKFAAKNNTEYLGHRWLLVDRDGPNASDARTIPETVVTRLRRTGLVAKMNADQSQVLQVFAKQSEAAEHIGQQASAMSQSLKFSTMLSNYYWKFWTDVSETIQQEYLTRGTLPHATAVENTRGTRVEKSHPDTGEVVETFSSITDAVKKIRISRKTIRLVSERNTVYQGHKWKPSRDPT